MCVYEQIIEIYAARRCQTFLLHDSLLTSHIYVSIPSIVCMGRANSHLPRYAKAPFSTIYSFKITIAAVRRRPWRQGQDSRRRTNLQFKFYGSG